MSKKRYELKKGIFIFIGILILVSAITLVSAARLPTDGGDSDVWGGILITFLNVSLNESGELRPSNFTFAQKVTFALGEVIDNIIDGWVRITGGLNVTNDLEVGGNISIGGTSLTLNGTEVCLSDGTNCVGSGSFYFNKTSTTYTGSLSGGGFVGYRAGNYICDQEFSGTHLCYQSELILTIDQANISNLSQWTGNPWIISGGAKFSPASVPVNDCNGFTHGTPGTFLGSFWIFNQTDGGVGGVGHCGNSFPLACCKLGGAG